MPRGFTLFSPGEIVRHVWFPIDGVCSFVTVLRDGAAIETATIGREGAVGLMGALSRAPAFSRAIGQVAGATIRIPAEPLQACFAASPSFRDLTLRHGQAQLAQAQQSVACNAMHAVEARFCRWLLMCRDRTGSDVVGLTQEFLAQMLGVQRTTVTQVAQGLQKQGILRYRRGEIELLQVDALQRLTCECFKAVEEQIEANLPLTDFPAIVGRSLE